MVPAQTSVLPPVPTTSLLVVSLADVMLVVEVVGLLVEVALVLKLGLVVSGRLLLVVGKRRWCHCLYTTGPLVQQSLRLAAGPGLAEGVEGGLRS